MVLKNTDRFLISGIIDDWTTSNNGIWKLASLQKRKVPKYDKIPCELSKQVYTNQGNVRLEISLRGL